MLKKSLVICALMIYSFIGLQANEKEISAPHSKNQQEMLACEKNNQPGILVCETKDKKDALLAACKRCKDKDKDNKEFLACCEDKKVQPETLACCEKHENKDLVPGALVCNDSEDKCTKDGEKVESVSSILFSVFNKDVQDEANLVACKDCQ